MRERHEACDALCLLVVGERQAVLGGTGVGEQLVRDERE
jgi:hypothetical protein